MFIDASALVAIIAGESDGTELAGRLRNGNALYTSPIAIYEATLALQRIRRTTIGGVARILYPFLTRLQVEMVPITPEIGRLALQAFERFGRGNHPARLNMGDCFAYACARSLGVPLLFKGRDFPQTDIAVA